MKVKENSKQCGIKEKSEQFGILHIILVSSFTSADRKMSSHPANHLVDFTIFQHRGRVYFVGPISANRGLKGQCHEIFDFWFFHESLSPKPLSTVYHKGRFEFFRKFAEIFTAQGPPLVSTKKSSIIKVLISVFGHLWEVELTYRYILAFKLSLRSQQPDIFPIICHRCH